MKIDGMDDWLKKIETLKKEFPKQTKRFLMMKAEEVIAETKRNTPVDTGTLRNAWQRENGGSFRQIVYNSTSYANHIEWGHRVVRGKKTVGKYIPAIGKELKTPFVKGRRMLHKGVLKVRLNFYRDLDKVYKNLIEK